MQSAGPPGTQRFILALVHLKVPRRESYMAWHGRAEAPPRPGCLGPPSGSIHAMAKPLRGGTLSSQQQQPPLVGTVLGGGSWSFIMGGVCKEDSPDRRCLPVEAEWGEKNEERRSTKKEHGSDI
ncbi:uncharacterized protein TrAtP1_010941 [Trichoderma atroviride]|uniref:uncharacterized protein n=1 Tax=Hypocrea atroviridis TaxID=63577 RepID=UPI00331C59ED|nr:hypothetical protein TrAtP1_010941 [Trichoderma atroviride]